MKKISKKQIYNVCALLIVIILSLFAVIPLQSAKADNSDWMAELDDERAINTLSIPGTHDSGALHSFGDVFGKCQTLSVGEQMKIGVRFLDVRLQLVGNELKVVHSIADQMTSFNDTLTDMITFLRENPTEFLIVSFKEDADPKRSDIDFAAALEQQLLSYDEVSRSTTLPKTVGEARGKLHVIARYSNATIGVPCGRGWIDDDSFELSGMYIQDNYTVGSSGEKFLDVTNALAIAAKCEYTLVLNYASCYISPSFPPIYAGIPAHDVNYWLAKTLTLTDDPCGVLLCDFITSDLADLIIRRNF